jgi:site-specific DNA recombinase
MRTRFYGRYSSDQQSAASIDDQLRNCRTWCQRQGLPEPATYTDAAISGARNDRPGYLRLLAEARPGDVIVVDDLSRLSRDSIETAQAIRRLTFGGVRVVGVSDGVDTGRKGHKAEVGLRGIMSELYLADLADKTHRGLAGKALSGASAGGLPYGYRVAGVGQRVVDEAQAAVVRRIFADYLDGKSPREISAALNREGLSPARGGTWSASAIHGDLRRGIGILVNPIYAGRQVWNRSRFLKHPDTGRRIRQERPESDWIIVDKPELAIVDTAAWEAVQARLRRSRLPGRHQGRQPRHLLSGILRCGQCGGPMVVIDRYRYGCATAKDRGTCTSTVRFPRVPAEAALLTGIKRDLLSEAMFQRFQREAAATLKKAAPDGDAAKRRLVDAEREVANLVTALRAGIITPSTKAALQDAERGVDAARAQLVQLQRYQPAQFLPRAREVWKRMVATLEDSGRNVSGAREAIRELVGDTIVVHEKAGDLFAEIAGSSCQIDVVAGAGYVPYLPDPIWIRLPRSGRE